MVCLTELDKLCDCGLLVVCHAKVSLKGCLKCIEVHPRGSSTCKRDCVGSCPVCCTIYELIEDIGPHNHCLEAKDSDIQGGVVDPGLGHKAKAILSRLAIVLARGHLGEESGNVSYSGRGCWSCHGRQG